MAILDEQALTNAGAVYNFHDGEENSASFKFKQKTVQKMLK